MAGIVRGRCLFARQLALAVYRERVCPVEFVIRPIAQTVEDVIGRNVNERYAEFATGDGEVARRDGVELVHPGVIGFRAVDVGVSGGVDYDVGAMRRNGLARVFKPRDVQSLMRKRDDFMPGQNRLQRAPKLPAGARDQYLHSNSSLTGGVGNGEWGVGSGEWGIGNRRLRNHFPYS